MAICQGRSGDDAVRPAERQIILVLTRQTTRYRVGSQHTVGYRRCAAGQGSRASSAGQGNGPSVMRIRFER